MKILLIAALTAALSGCLAGHTSEYEWIHTTKAQHEYYEDNSYCMALARDLPDGLVIGEQKEAERSARAQASRAADRALGGSDDLRMRMVQKAAYRKCMIGKGWISVKKP